MKSGPQSVCRTLFACFLVVLALGGVLPAVSQDAPVYISKSGQKYHRIDCRALRSSKQKISLKDALNAGYEAC
ncbi:MAG: hypothetical protein LBH18_07285, partial [Spirochaetaceae bacterium]|nr:hypothetical protein [Spirochaetaceae bacterium]